MSKLSKLRPEAVHESFIDEQAIAVLRLPFHASAQTQGIPHYLALVRDAGKPWRCLMPQCFDWPDASEIIQTACEHRAVLTVDGGLRVARRRVTPEVYLRRWRRAIGSAGDITLWRTLDSVRPVARFELDACVLRSAISDPGRDFHDLPALVNTIIDTGTGVLAAGPRPASLSESAPAALRLSIDLTKCDGARHAWWVQHLLLSVPRAISSGASLSTIEMSRLDGGIANESVEAPHAAQRALLQGALRLATTGGPAATSAAA